MNVAQSASFMGGILMKAQSAPSHTPPAVMTYSSTISSTTAEYLPTCESVNSGDRPHNTEVDQPCGSSHPTATTPAKEAPPTEKVMFRAELASPFGHILF